MIAYCSEKLSDWLIRNGAVKKEDRELYEYAIYIVVLYPSGYLRGLCFHGSDFGCAASVSTSDHTYIRQEQQKKRPESYRKCLFARRELTETKKSV